MSRSSNANPRTTHVARAYAAGLLDGEGTIEVHKAAPYQRRVSPRYALRARVANTVRAPLLWLQRLWGGSVPSKGASGCYEWVVYSDKARRFLEEIRPYLQIKEEQCWLGLEYIFSITKHPGRVPMPKEERALREGFYLALQAAKRL